MVPDVYKRQTKNSAERVEMGSYRFMFAFATSLAIQSFTLLAVSAPVSYTHLSMRRTPDLQKEEPTISSPPIDLISSALADFRG